MEDPSRLSMEADSQNDSLDTMTNGTPTAAMPIASDGESQSSAETRSTDDEKSDTNYSTDASEIEDQRFINDDLAILEAVEPLFPRSILNVHDVVFDLMKITSEHGIPDTATNKLLNSTHAGLGVCQRNSTIQFTL